jgi:hypothetical protein
MSVAHTADAVIERRKTVTRRPGWLFLKVGDRLTLCRKVMGRKPGEPLARLAEVEVTSLRREPLYMIGLADVRAEGFSEPWGPDEFVWFFVNHIGGRRDQIVTRIEWRYVARLIENEAATTAAR